MADTITPVPRHRFPMRSQVSLGWAFVERQTNLWKRHLSLIHI